MCGIAGIFRQGGVGAPEIEQVRRMNRIQFHRGPDDEGLFHDATCVLGHRRLAIIDLSDDGHQPFISSDGRYVLVYNGEIYNYPELRDRLIQRGRKFYTKTDTEVLLAAYMEYGPACLERFNGMFAFAVYDTHQRTLFLARDRVGIKPLYYLQRKDEIVFSSEIKSLRSIPHMCPEVNYQSLFDFLAFNRTDIFDETFVKEIRRLPKGHYAYYRNGALAITQWWTPADYVSRDGNPGIQQAAEQVHEILSSSVKMHMRSDVKVGSCLSGGLDSSILIGLLFQMGLAQEDYPAFTAAFPGHPIDETQFVAELNQKYPFVSHQTFPTAQDAYEDLAHFVFMNDEPTTSPSFYSQYKVMQKARSQGVIVLLDGQGGDENFAGYQYFHGFNLFGLLGGHHYRIFTLELIKSLLRRQHVSAYQTLLFQLLPSAIKKKLLLGTLPLLRRRFFQSHVNSSRIFNQFFDAPDLNTALVRHFQYKLEHLLRMEDRNAMAFSIEARVPYLDYRLIEYLLGLAAPLKLKRGETKYLQKKALARYTVPGILARTDKIGFGTPGEHWMKTKPWADLTRENYRFLCREFQEMFRAKPQGAVSAIDAWKINQLATWYRGVKQGGRPS